MSAFSATLRNRPLPTETDPVPARRPQRHQPPPRHASNEGRAATAQPHVLADQERCALDLLCLSSPSPGNPGLPSSAILAPVEPPSEEAKRSLMPLSDWRPSASAAPIAPRSPRSPRQPRNRTLLAAIPPGVTIFRPAHLCRKDTAVDDMVLRAGLELIEGLTVPAESGRH